MSNQIYYTGVSPQRYVSTLSRYSNSEVIQYGKNNVVTFATYVRPDTQINPTDTVFLINASTAYRPDKVSKMKYGFVDWWWKIMQANQIYDIMEFKAGRTIYLPAASL